MNRMNLVISLLLVSTSAFSGKLIMEGKVYSLTEQEQEICGERQSPTYFAAIGVISFARGMGENMRVSACSAGIQKKCSKDDIKMAGQKMVFKRMRAYPSRFRSEGCSDLRDKCEKDCKGLKLYSDTECLIECNQYESYQR